MKQYTVAEFRVRLKEGLDKAETGEEVVINRRGVVFILKKPYNQEAYSVKSKDNV